MTKATKQIAAVVLIVGATVAAPAQAGVSKIECKFDDGPSFIYNIDLERRQSEYQNLQITPQRISFVVDGVWFSSSSLDYVIDRLSGIATVSYVDKHGKRDRKNARCMKIVSDLLVRGTVHVMCGSSFAKTAFPMDFDRGRVWHFDQPARDVSITPEYVAFVAPVLFDWNERLEVFVDRATGKGQAFNTRTQKSEPFECERIVEGYI